MQGLGGNVLVPWPLTLIVTSALGGKPVHPCWQLPVAA
jgi:hypothetical protein